MSHSQWRLKGRICFLLAAVSSCAQFATPAVGADRVWIGSPAVDDWHNPLNWLAGLPPNAADNALIGSAASATNSIVRVTQDVAVAGLEITDRMRVITQDGLGSHGRLVVLGDTYIDNVPNTYKAELRVFAGGGPPDFITDDLYVGLNSEFSLNYGAVATINGVLTNTTDGQIGQLGTFNFTGAGTTLINDGVISAGGDGLVLNQLGGGRYNLDGQLGNGRLELSYQGHPGQGLDALTLNGVGLTDSFSGLIEMTTGRRLTMNLTEGWTADQNSLITIGNSSAAQGPARIEGDAFTLAGQMDLQNGSLASLAWARVSVSTTIESTAQVNVGAEALLNFHNSAVVNGGQFTLAEGAQFLDFTGGTVLRGGSFTTHSESLSDGSVQFRGLTEWDGEVSVSGIARQMGDATVTGITSIDADRFDMDGAPESLGGLKANWLINSRLTINAGAIEVGASNEFDSTMTIGGGSSQLLRLNLTEPSDYWTMAGVLNLSNDFALGNTKLAGSEMRLTGTLNADGPLIRVTADAVFADGGEISFQTGESSLEMRGRTLVEAGAVFLGEGVLRNSGQGHMTLADGVETDFADLANNSLLDIAGGTGIATVDDFENQANGTLGIDIGGYLLGETFDHLMVAGEATIDGALGVDLLVDEFGPGNPLPVIGDEFIILTSLDGVSGQFADVLPTYALGHEYGWEVIYNPHDITIRLESISVVSVPEPCGVALAAVAATLTSCCNRSRQMRLSSCATSADSLRS